MLKRLFLRPGGVFLRNSKTQNQQMGVSQPWGKDPGQLAPRKVSYVQSNCVTRHRLWAIILQKTHLLSGVVLLSNSKTQNQQFGVLWLWNRVPGHWPSQGAKLWPFKGAKTGVFGFSRGVTYSEYLSWHVANTISSLTAALPLSLDTTPS